MHNMPHKSCMDSYCSLFNLANFIKMIQGVIKLIQLFVVCNMTKTNFLIQKTRIQGVFLGANLGAKLFWGQFLGHEKGCICLHMSVSSFT